MLYFTSYFFPIWLTDAENSSVRHFYAVIGVLADIQLIDNIRLVYHHKIVKNLFLDIFQLSLKFLFAVLCDAPDFFIHTHKIGNVLCWDSEPPAPLPVLEAAFQTLLLPDASGKNFPDLLIRYGFYQKIKLPIKLSSIYDQITFGDIAPVIIGRLL